MDSVLTTEQSSEGVNEFDTIEVDKVFLNGVIVYRGRGVPKENISVDSIRWATLNEHIVIVPRSATHVIQDPSGFVFWTESRPTSGRKQWGSNKIPLTINGAGKALQTLRMPKLHKEWRHTVTAVRPGEQIPLCARDGSFVKIETPL